MQQIITSGDTTNDVREELHAMWRRHKIACLDYARTGNARSGRDRRLLRVSAVGLAGVLGTPPKTPPGR